jgi:integral membrane protein
VKSALTRYRVLAYATGVFLLLLTANIILKYLLHTAHLGPWVAIGHGWLYLAYVVVTVDLWFRTRLDVLRTALVVLAGTVPFMSFVAERWVRAQVEPLVAAEERAAAPSAGPARDVGSLGG